jgi:hypothetical protein
VLAPVGGRAAPPASSVNTSAATSSLRIVNAFPGTTVDADVTAFGQDQGVTPPDTQLAAGPNDILSAVNSTLLDWSTAGVKIANADLNVFFNVANGFSFSDPRVAYDSAAGRWFISGIAFDSAYDSVVYLAVSGSADPTASYYVYVVSSRQAVIQDQPKLGFDSAVVVLSWADYSGPAFVGEETSVLQKSDLLSGANTSSTTFGPDTGKFGIVPAQTSATTSSEYLVYNNSCGANTARACTAGTSPSSFGLVSITGTPATGYVTWNETDLAMPATSVPPNADQPGAPASIATNDDRFLSAVYVGGAVYVSGNDGCTPSGATVVEPCLRLVKASTGGSPTLALDADLGYAGGALYFPAVAADGGGNAFMAATFSSTTVSPQVVAVSAPSGTSSFSSVVVQQGTGAYGYTGCDPTFGCRWGDYSGAAVDAVNPAEVWVAGEYAPSSGANWGTAIGEVTLEAPPPDNKGVLYSLDGWGGIHPIGSAPTVSGTGYWPGWDIARGIASRPDLHSGYVLDGWGGIHAFGGAPAMSSSAYWPGWDIARGIALTPDGGGGWVVDGYGGVHPFGDAPAVAVTYWSGRDIIRGVTADATGRGGWVLDGFGALHEFGDAPALLSGAYWSGWDIARAVVLTTDKGGGYVMDAWGGLHPFGSARAVTNGPYWPGWNIARAVAMWSVSSSGQPGGWIVDGFGGVHAFGNAPQPTTFAYWPGWDIARGIGGGDNSGGSRA